MIKINISTEEMSKRKQRMDNVWNFKKNERPAFMCFVDAFQYLRHIGMECEEYLKDPKTHFETQLMFQKYMLEEFSTDQYSVNPTIDLLVIKHASAYGSPIRYINGSLPWADHWIKNEADLLLLEKMNVSDNGLYLREKEFLRYVIENSSKFPVELSDGNIIFPLKDLHAPRFVFTGSFTVAQMLMGMEQLYLACFDEPEFVHKLLDIITNKCIEHWMKLVKEFDVKNVEEISLTDDSATFLNPEMFSEFCMPYLKRIRNVFPEAKLSLHFCKTVPEYVKALTDEFRIDAYTGFKPNSGINSIIGSFKPVNDILGNKLVLYPDPDPCIIETANNEEVYKATYDILDAFKDTNGVCVSFSTWSPEKSRWGMKACMDFAMGIRESKG